MDRIDELISFLDLKSHPEGGFYRETYRSGGVISQQELGDSFSGARHFSTGIYFLIIDSVFSAFHRIKQDEMWHFYEGDPLRVHMIDDSGNYTYQDIGLDFKQNQQPQFVVPAGLWFASEVAVGGTYSFVGCTVAPGFDFADFEMAERADLIFKFPMHQQLIKRLTRL